MDHVHVFNDSESNSFSEEKIRLKIREQQLKNLGYEFCKYSIEVR